MKQGMGTWRTRRSQQQHAHENMDAAPEHSQMMTLVNSLTDAVLSTDAHGVITIYNAAMIGLLDTNATLHGHHINEIFQLQTLGRTPINVFEELSKSPSIRTRDDLIMPLSDGDHLRLEATFAPILGGSSSTDGYVLILRDVTKIKSLEEERDEFISVVSHELRTPVAIAEGALDNARLLAEKGYTQKVHEALVAAHDQVMFLAKMINDLGTLSRAERGAADETETINLMELASTLHSEFAPRAAEKGLRFDLDVSAQIGVIKVSRLYLTELLQNFIINAIKYTPRGGVTLRMHRRNGAVQFAVIDTGIGIGKTDQKKIFQRFYRAEDYRTRETSGTGLGLYVAGKLAHKLGCTISVKSRLNHGSTFSFELADPPTSA